MAREPESEPTSEEGPRSFTRFLEQLAEGEANADLSADLSEALFELGALSRKEAIERGGEIKAELTLTLKFKTDQIGQSVVTYGIKVKEPVAARPATMLWLTGAGNFSSDNPRQQRLPLMEVVDEHGVVREVGDLRRPREV